MGKESFFEREHVELSFLESNKAIPFGIEKIHNTGIGIGGAYCAWGKDVKNNDLPDFMSERLNSSFLAEETMNLDELGFLSRHQTPRMSQAEYREVEIEVGTKLVKGALEANSWDPKEVDGLFVGSSGPVSPDYLIEIANRAGIREDALKIDIHKACDGSMGALQLVMNENSAPVGDLNIAREMKGKKVLIGGFEGLSRMVADSMDKNALQLFGNGAGIFGFIPGESMKFLVGKSFENFDTEGLLQVKMLYPHSRIMEAGKSLIETYQESKFHLRLSGMMHEPLSGMNVWMAGLMGMVKLFVRSGVDVASDVYNDYRDLMKKMGTPERNIKFSVVHHANFKINQLKAKQLQKVGINYPMPWILSDFGNVSAASCVIAFLRQLDNVVPGDHILFDGFGAGTFYDVMALEMGKS
ncbi:MAG TPA: 3-oxoacyl-[acyl-carrier-protein] synthase III C-terminal domain-containing protein [Anaerolineales bacterium]|nr:3-oxoacyl-[acyl-carrier-protein] synthase III C-terminal domain-containing protein [Anaerolineales bacterium]